MALLVRIVLESSFVKSIISIHITQPLEAVVNRNRSLSALRTSFGALMICSVVIALMGTTLAAQQATDWPTFRGPDRTGVAPDTGLLKSWPEGGPELLWTAKGAGNGYASVSIADGRFYTLGDGLSTADDKDEYLTCFDLKDGKQLWKSKTGSPWRKGQRAWQTSRSTPTIDGDRVYVATPDGKLVCVSTDGNENWRIDLKEKFNGKKADIWGYSESVLIDGELLICTPGGPKNTMVALNKNSGETIWTTARAGDRGAGHASIVISQAGETKVYVQTTGSGAMGVRASDGKLLWTYDIDKTTAVIPTPIVRDDLIFFSAGYKRGGALLRQKSDGNNEASIEEVYPLQRKLSNKHGGIVLVGDYLYGDSDDAGTPFCAEFKTGEIKWKSRGSSKQSASIVAADGHLYILYHNGTMTLVKADPESFQEVGSFKVPDSRTQPSWAHPVIHNGRLYLRESDSVLCYKLTEGDSAEAPMKMDDAKKPAAAKAAGEMLTNGNFADGTNNWWVDKGDGETASVEVAKEGPNEAAALKINVLSAPDESWQLQAFNAGLKIEKDKSYILTFWAKSKSAGTIKVNCMHNHEPWEHSTEEEFYLSDKWTKKEFSFDGPWDDDNARITFTDLGQETGQVYWFANVSLIAK